MRNIINEKYAGTSEGNEESLASNTLQIKEAAESLDYGWDSQTCRPGCDWPGCGCLISSGLGRVTWALSLLVISDVRLP